MNFPATRLGALLRRHLPALGVLWALQLAIVSPMFPPTTLASQLHWGDAQINCWAINWGQHASWREPWNYFDAPLFHPQERAGAFSSSNPLLGALTAPARLSGNPVLAYNLAMLAAVLLTGTAAYGAFVALLAHRRAAVLGALVFATNGDTVWHLAGHPNVVSPIFLPIALAALVSIERLGATTDGRAAAWGRPLAMRAAWLAGALVAQFACDWYLGIIGLAMAAAWLAGSAVLALGRVRAHHGAMAAALVVALVVAFVASSPYRDVARRFGNTRGLGEVLRQAADPLGYVLPPHTPDRDATLVGSLVARALPWKPRGENAQFVGWLAIALAATGFVTIVRRGRVAPFERRVALLVAVVGVTGFVCSLGPRLWIGPRFTGVPLPYLALWELVPPLRFMRAVSRYAVLVELAIALLAAAAIARAAWPNRGSLARRLAIAAAVVVVVVVEFRPVSPSGRRTFAPAAFDAFRRLDASRVIAPVPLTNNEFLVLAATTLPRTPAGYEGGVENVHYEAIRARVDAFPADSSLELLEALDVATIVVFGADRAAQARAHLRLRELHPIDGDRAVAFEFAAPGDASAIAAARAWLDALPERPRPTPAPPPEERVVARTLLKAPAGGYLDWEYMSFLRPWGAALRVPLPMTEVTHVWVEMGAADPSLEIGRARVYWTTAERPNFGEDRTAAGRFVADGSVQVVSIDLRAAPGFRADERLERLRVDFIDLPYPGQRARVEGIALGTERAGK